MYGFWQLIILPITRIWPNRDRWIVEFKHNSFATSPIELQRVIRAKDERLNWTSPEKQAAGDSIKIDLGKYRIIDGIEFYEKHPSNEFPQSWRLLLEDEWSGLAARPIDGTGRIVKKFPKTKLHAIEIIIRKPMLVDSTAYNWRISIIYLREIKLFGRWLRGKI